MNKSKNKLTFAERANKIIKKFPRSDFDKIEKEQLNRELDALSKEQEQYKIDNGMVNDTKSFALGGATTGTINSLNNIGVLTQDANNIGFINDPNELVSGANTLNDLYGSAYQGSINNIPPVEGNQVEMTSTSRGMLPSENLSPYRTSILPSIASGAITIGGNLLMANRAKQDQPELNLGRLSPERISLARERSKLRQRGELSSRIGRNNVAKGSRTRGEYLSTSAAQDAAMERGTSDALSKLYSQESRMNAAERARVAEFNAQMAAKEAAANFEARKKEDAEESAYQSAALQTVPQVMSNISSIQQQDALINSLGQDYSIAQYEDPSLNWFQRITQPKQIVRKYNKK